MAYARRLGFEPAPDFAPAAAHLGSWRERSDITFGRDDVPLYVQGPYDNPHAALRTLTRPVGAGNFDYLLVAATTAVHHPLTGQFARAR